MTAAVSTSSSPYPLSTDDSRRISIVRVWFMLMVLFIHSNRTNAFFGNVQTIVNAPDWLVTLKYVISFSISRCAVPGFFFLSSVLLYRKPLNAAENIRKKARQLLLPLFLLTTLWIAAFYVAQHIPFLAPFFGLSTNIIANWSVMDFLNAYLGFRGEYLPLVYPLWFLRDLFVLNLLAMPIKRVVDRFPMQSLAAALLVWLVLPSSPLFFLALDGICFWVMGCVVVNKRIPLHAADRFALPLGAVYALLVALDTLTRAYTWQLPIHRLMILVGLVAWYTLATRIRSKRIGSALLWLSGYNFSVYLFHENLMYGLKKFITRFTARTPLLQTLDFFLVPLLMVALCVGISLVLQRLTPRLYGLLVGAPYRHKAEKQA